MNGKGEWNVYTKTINKVPLLDLQAQYEPIKDEVLTAMKDVFESKQFIQGPKVVELEEMIKSYCNVNYAIGVSSGTDALIVALMAMGIGHGDEVITSPFTFFFNSRFNSSSWCKANLC